MAACGRAGNDKQAVWLLGQMRERGVTPNRISYSAAMFALSKAGRLADVSRQGHASSSTKFAAFACGRMPQYFFPLRRIHYLYLR